jgi:arabinan endo-1,5-alpha-L-arabinosidase
MRSFANFLGFSLTLAATTYAYANPGACSGVCVTHDPSVVRRSSDGKFFRFTTGNEILVATADAITGPWTNEGSALPGGSSINLAGNTDLWAPDVNLVGSTYMMYYAVSTFGSQNSAIGVATSTTMEVGSWVDHGATGVSSDSSKIYNAIDPNFIQTTTGEFLLNFGSFWDDIYQVELGPTAMTTLGSSYNMAYNSSGTHAVEGSFMYYEAPYYYLFFSSGTCCGFTAGALPAAGTEYKIMVGRSTSPTSGFVDATGKSLADGGGTLVLPSHGTVYAPGGQGVMDHPTYGAVLYYHYLDTSIGYADGDAQFGWNQITWSNGWPTV